MSIAVVFAVLLLLLIVIQLKASYFPLFCQILLLGYLK